MRMKLLPFLAMIAILATLGQALDEEVQQKAVAMYQYWLPEAHHINYQAAVYDALLLEPHLRQQGHQLRVAEMPASLTNRMFLMPLNLYLEHQTFGLTYQYRKVHFAAFTMPWDSDVAVFQGVGAINGVSRKKLADRLVHGVDFFLPLEYGITLHVP